jgi:hypothetical protein
VNYLTAAKYYGTPFAGARRNLQRGDTIQQETYLSRRKDHLLTSKKYICSYDLRHSCIYG